MVILINGLSFCLSVGFDATTLVLVPMVMRTYIDSRAIENSGLGISVREELSVEWVLYILAQGHKIL